MKSSNIFAITVVLLSFLGATAQDVPVTHFMHLNPYQLYSDPTADIPYNGYFTFPLLGNVNVGIYNNAFHYDKIFECDENGYPTTITANRFVNSLAKYNNFVTADFNEELLGLGFRIKEKSFLSLSYRLRTNAEFSFSKDLPGFLVLGNMAYLGDGNEADMRIGLQVTAYHEISLGIQHKVNDHFTLGIRPKILFGAFNAQVQTLQVRVHTDPSNYGITAYYDAQANIASCMPITMDLNNGHYYFKFGEFNGDVINNSFRNIGGAIDLGLRYNPTTKVGVSLAVTDLGVIRWKTNTYQITNESSTAEGQTGSTTFQFNGLTNEDIEMLTSEGGMAKLLDSLADYFPLSSTPINSYTTNSHSRVQAQFDYNFTPSNRISVLTQGRIYDRSIHPALTVAYNGSFFKTLDVCVAYTLQPNSYDNLAVGLGLNLGLINIYATTHNLLPVFSRTYLSKLTANVGVVFNWGHLKKQEKISE